MRKISIIIALLSAAFTTYAADTVSYRVNRIENWAFYGTQSPKVELVAFNGRGIPKDMDLKCTISDYKGKPLYELGQTGQISPKDSLSMAFTFKALSPGFYNASFTGNGAVVKSFNIAYEPEKIIAEEPSYDKPAVSKGNFPLLLLQIRDELQQMQRNFTMVKNKMLSGREKNVYDITILSRGGETINGYAAFPKGKTNLKAMITLVPVQLKQANPLADFTTVPQMAEFVIYIGERGQSEEYFKNLLSDVALCVEFVAGRREIDGNSIYMQGDGKAAPLALVASAVNRKVRMSFISNPDFSHFLESYNPHSIAAEIKVPVLWGMGLQDSIERVQQNFLVYNNLECVKEYIIFPDKSAVERKKWRYMRDTFIIRQ